MPQNFLHASAENVSVRMIGVFPKINLKGLLFQMALNKYQLGI